MRWRLLPYSRYPAALNMAIDEAIAEAVRDGTAPPTIRFYGWDPSAVTIGCFQAAADVVDLEECHRLRIDVVRRRTGGGSVYHDSDGEITYSVIAPEAAMEGDIQASYRQVCGWVMAALSDLGLSPAYAPINDITVGGRKVSGCAQTRRGGVFLQHGTVLYSLDRGRMFSVLKVCGEKVADKGLATPEDRVTSISELSSASKVEVLTSLQRAFCQWKEWYEMPLSTAELTRASDLVRERYSNPQWTLSR